VSVEAIAAKLDAGLAIAPRAAPLSAVEAPVLEAELQLECTQAMLLALTRPERIAFILADVLGATDAIGEGDPGRRAIDLGGAVLRLLEHMLPPWSMRGTPDAARTIPVM
jgi:hypothetical protein